ncbi:uncharacterized protein LOC133814503 [Humulus lupulus]|uniref:uncharacterized protein LOC133814503 n=1 Tax=Humulus lupulus TaxID=3486 RepID=UPI002B414F2F|nr:uncharacterized protein LOC133814503 [Humulus lupulus]
MTNEFEMSMVGELTYFLGLQVKQSEDGTFISQSKYAKNLVKKFGMESAKHAKTPMGTIVKLTKDESGVKVDPTLYRSMIGSLLYLTASCPDISYSVGVCARYQGDPMESHVTAAKRIICYVNGNADDRKSTSGGCFYLGNNLFFSHSRATMVRTRGNGSRSVKSVAGSLTASPSLTKKKARKSTLSHPIHIDGSITTSKAVVIPDLEAPKVPTELPTSAAPLASKKSKGWFQVSSFRKSPCSKGTDPSDSSPKASSPVGSTPRSKFRSKVKKIPPPCSSSETDPSSYCVPSDEDPLEDDPSLEENVGFEDESDPSEDPPVSPKGKKSVKIPEIRTKSPLGPKVSLGSSFKAHSLNFCFNDNEKNMKHYVHRDFICEKKISFSAHRVFGVIKNVEDRGWLGSLTGLDGFVPRVVQEFYANLNDDLFDRKYFMFGQVYVRENRYLFNAAEIAKVLNLPLSVDNVAVEFNKDKVLLELVGQNMVWEPHSVLKVTDLTYYYAVLHKFATSNWIPTTHTSTITFDTAFFLNKVGTGLQVDLASLIFDQITALENAKKKGQYLVFPHLIYKLLDSQKHLLLEYEILTPSSAGANYKLKKEPSTVKATKGIALKTGDADSVAAEHAGVKATLESVQTEVISLKSYLSTMVSRFAADPSN